MKDNYYTLDHAQKEQIESRLRDLLEVCQLYGVPVYATAAIENNEEDTVYNRIIYSAQAHQMKLTNDQIRKHMLVANGFEVVAPRDKLSIDMSTILGE